jgi:pimeloyl-ACP methyl ester carboxylesterase
VQSLNVRLLAVDRPGMGLSDFQPNRSTLDFPMDIVALADRLHIDRFAILAYSLGGPHGLACAYTIPERLWKVGLVSGAALFTEPDLMDNINPGTRRYLNLPRENPKAARLFLWMMAVMVRWTPQAMVKNATRVLPDVDRQVMAEPEMQRGFISMLREALRQGTRGVFHESLMAVTDWGFQLEEVRTPVLLWHGEADQNIPVEMARHAEKTLPVGELRIFPGEGHLSLIKKNLPEIMEAVVD